MHRAPLPTDCKTDCTTDWLFSIRLLPRSVCMSTTFAPSAWPSSRPLPTAWPWRFARELRAPQGHADAAVLQWLMARHSSFSSTRLVLVYGVLSLMTLGIGLAFWFAGAPTVLPLAGVEMLLLGAAFWICGRHAGDAETITLAQRVLRVEHCFGRHVDRAAFRAEWVRVEPEHGEGSLIELSGQGRRMRVGRYLRPELRMALARELRLALRRDAARPLPDDAFVEQQR